jgi:hypothetical protein
VVIASCVAGPTVTDTVDVAAVRTTELTVDEKVSV